MMARLGEVENTIEARERIIRTLDQCWSVRLTRLPAGPQAKSADGDHWVLNRMLGVCHRTDASPAVLQYLRESSRCGGRASRRVGQWVVGASLTSRPGLRVFGTPLFGAPDTLPDQRDLLVLLGNRRVRVFDFAAGTCRTQLKHGYGTEPMDREIAVRFSDHGQTSAAVLFPPIESVGPDHTWFEEAIVDGWALPRVPSNLNSGELGERAVANLTAWLAATASPMSAHVRTGELTLAISGHLAALHALGEDWATMVQGWSKRLTTISSRLSSIDGAFAHGDFQPGNVLVERGTGRVLITDWEHSGRRWASYDILVWRLRSRWPKGLARRLVGALSPDWQPPGMYLPRATHQRRAALSLFLLEDLEWRLAEARSRPSWKPSPRDGLTLYLAEILRLGPDLQSLLGRTS